MAQFGGPTMQWMRNWINLLITGPTGICKSWIAYALGKKACREDLSTLIHFFTAGCHD